MTEETATAPVARKRTGGWNTRRQNQAASRDEVVAAADRAAAPKGSLLAKMKSRPNWESEDYVGVGQDGVDRLRIAPDIVKALHRDGVSLQWVTKSVRGMEQPQEVSKMTRGGWTPVHQSDFDGVLDGMFMPKGDDGSPIIVDDCMLVARPAEIQAKARLAERRDANRPLQIAEDQLGHGIPGVTGSNDRSVHNSIKRTVERIEIPD